MEGLGSGAVVLVSDDAGWTEIRSLLAGSSLESALCRQSLDDLRNGWTAARFDLIVLDARVGLRVAAATCRHLRDLGYTRAIAGIGPAAAEGTEAERTLLDAGADDVILRPLSVRRLEARIRALSRRRSGTYLAAVQAGTVALDPSTGGARVNGAPVHLTRTEFRILLTLVRRAGSCVSAMELAATCTDAVSAHGDTRKIRVHVAHLEAKLRDAGKVIHNVPGVGYVFRAGVCSASRRAGS